MNTTPPNTLKEQIAKVIERDLSVSDLEFYGPEHCSKEIADSVCGLLNQQKQGVGEDISTRVHGGPREGSIPSTRSKAQPPVSQVVDALPNGLSSADVARTLADRWKAYAECSDETVIFLSKERDKLQAFKDYVHKRLDDAGIPTHPEGEHSTHGCRIGDRLDIALATSNHEAQHVKSDGVNEIPQTIIKFPKNFCWETNDQLNELIKQAEECLQYTEENSVGYYYYWMLQVLKEKQAEATKAYRQSLPEANHEGDE